MNRLTLTAAVAAAAVVGGMASAEASTVTLDGTDFTVTYDPTTLGIFGTLSVVGDNLFFTPNGFSATSTNGQQVVQTTATVNLTLTAIGNFQFGALNLQEFGDYQMQGPGSSVSVSGQLRAFDVNNAFNTQTASNITANPSLPLTIDNNTDQNWAAGATINNSTATVTGGGQGWLAQANTINLTLENILQAYTQLCPVSGCTAAESAFIQKKFDGVEVSVTPVPLPGSAWLLAAGLLGWIGLGLPRGSLMPRHLARTR